MKIYKRFYDNPIDHYGAEKKNEFIGEYEIIETIIEDGYSAIRIGMENDKLFLINETEVCGFNSGSRFDVYEIKSARIKINQK